MCEGVEDAGLCELSSKKNDLVVVFLTSRVAGLVKGVRLIGFRALLGSLLEMVTLVDYGMFREVLQEQDGTVLNVRIIRVRVTRVRVISI